MGPPAVRPPALPAGDLDQGLQPPCMGTGPEPRSIPGGLSWALPHAGERPQAMAGPCSPPLCQEQDFIPVSSRHESRQAGAALLSLFLPSSAPLPVSSPIQGRLPSGAAGQAGSAALGTASLSPPPGLQSPHRPEHCTPHAPHSIVIAQGSNTLRRKPASIRTVTAPTAPPLQGYLTPPTHPRWPHRRWQRPTPHQHGHRSAHPQPGGLRAAPGAGPSR